LKYQKYYEHIYLIKKHLGLKVIHFDYDTEEKLLYTFKITEAAFSRLENTGRSISYYYF
jgi:hypothetical protein